MYSQCPQCQAIFNVPESHIGAHEGLVRCGRCQAVFHAVTNKVEGLEVLEERRATTPKPSRPSAPSREERRPPATVAPAAVSPDASTRGAPATDRERPAAPEAPPREQRSDHRAAAHLVEQAANSGRYGSPGDQELDDVLAAAPEAEQPGEEPDRQEGVDDEARRDADWVEPALPKPGETVSEEASDDGFDGEVEEILIEAPPVLWNAFDEEVDAATDTADARSATTGREPDAGTAAPRPGPGSTPAAPPAAAGGRRLPLKSPYRAKDVQMVELPQPRPFKTASLSLLSVFLVLLLVWQVKTFYLDDLAQFPIARPYLEIVCRTLGCAMPPRRDFAQIELVGTSINVNPEVPGALEVNASLMNRAHFPQPYPPLRVTLTDRDGRIVGRRTYLPSDYRPDGASELLPIKARRDVSINLAQPAENAVGYEVELVSPTPGS